MDIKIIPETKEGQVAFINDDEQIIIVNKNDLTKDYHENIEAISIYKHDKSHTYLITTVGTTVADLNSYYKPFNGQIHLKF